MREGSSTLNPLSLRRKAEREEGWKMKKVIAETIENMKSRNGSEKWREQGVGKAAQNETSEKRETKSSNSIGLSKWRPKKKASASVIMQPKYFDVCLEGYISVWLLFFIILCSAEREGVASLAQKCCLEMYYWNILNDWREKLCSRPDSCSS